MKCIQVLTLALFWSGSLLAQDARDDEIFGGAAQPATDSPAAPGPVRAGESQGAQSLIDTLQIGGRLEVRANTGQEEQQKLSEASFSQLRQADVYFDARPNRDVRVFLRARFSEQEPTAAQQAAAEQAASAQSPIESNANEARRDASDVRTAIDELWFKWDLADSLFFTVGKQHLKWGSGRFWNPTDFTAIETRDPFALFDRRLGQSLLKVHFPVEKQGFNYYAVLQFDEAVRNDDVGLALRGEWAFFGTGELALSFQTRRDAPIRFGADLSTALGPIDVYIESAVSKRQQRSFYEGEFNPAAGQLPTAEKKEDDSFVQTVAGLQQTWKYSDDDNLTVGAEYFDNGLGYDDRELELYSLVMGDSPALYAGRRYAGAYVRLPAPGAWNDTSFFTNVIRNLSDETTVGRLTATWLLYKEATLEAFVSRCTGDYGELCFRVPESYKVLAQSPALPAQQQATIAALPSKRTQFTGGLGFSMSF